MHAPRRRYDPGPPPDRTRADGDHLRTTRPRLHTEPLPARFTASRMLAISAQSRLREPRHATRGHRARSHAPHACWRGTRTRQHRLRPPTRALVHLNTRKREATRGSDTVGKGRYGLGSRHRGGGTPSKPRSGCPEGTPSWAEATRPPPIDRSVDGGLSSIDTEQQPGRPRCNIGSQIYRMSGGASAMARGGFGGR